MKYSFLIFSLCILLLTNFVMAETTFFDQDDAFIMGDSVTDGVIEGTTGASTDGGGCLTNWTCSDWSFCNNGMQIRNCTKQKVYCYADLNKKPIESQNCSVDKSGDKNNMESGEEISNSPEIKAIKNNWYWTSGVIIIIIIIILVILGFVLHKKHRKRRYFSYGY